MISQAVGLLGLLVLSGCGSKNPNTVPVSGTVTHKGTPVEGATVLFSRGAGSMDKGEIAIGKTDASGRFELTTHFGSQASAGGAVPGDYKVSVSKLVPPKGMTQAQYQSMVEAANKIGETGAMVPSHQQPPPLVETFPAHFSALDRSRLKATVEASGSPDLVFALD